MMNQKNIIYDDQTPLEVATKWLDDGFTIEMYQKLQIRRMQRYNFWKQQNFHMMANKEYEIVVFGNIVIAIMKLLSK